MREEIRADPIASHAPVAPLDGPYGKGGRINASGTMTTYVMRNIHRMREKEEDPREALLKYDEETKRNPEFVTPAYAKNQPVT